MLDRAGEILEYLYNSDDSAGVSKISSDLDLPKATTFRILTTLEKWQIVEKQYNTDQYKLGMALIKYGAKVSSKLSLVELSIPIIDELANQVGESIFLNIEHQNFSLNVYKNLTSESSLMTSLIPLSPLNCSASGKIFLSKKNDDEIKKYFTSQFCKKRTINSIIDFDDYMEQKKLFENEHLMYDDEEYEYGLFCISKPIFYKNDIIAAVSVTGPKTRLEIKGMEAIEDELTSACNAISKLLEYLEPDKIYHN